MAKNLVKHLFNEQFEKMACAYIMGGPITEEDLKDPNIIPAQNADDLHVVISYNSVASADAVWDSLTKDNVNCINPVNWETDDTIASFEYAGTTASVHIDTANHFLIVEGFNPSDYYLEGCPFPLGNYHCDEIHFYAKHIKANALNRLIN